MAYYALLKLHILPHKLLEMDEQEKAFVVAAVQIKAKADREQEKKLASKGRGRRRR